MCRAVSAHKDVLRETTAQFVLLADNVAEMWRKPPTNHLPVGRWYAWPSPCVTVVFPDFSDSHKGGGIRCPERTRSGKDLRLGS